MRKKFGHFPFGRMDLVRPKDKYLSMIIDSKTNMPTHIPEKCNAKIDFRCFPHLKEKIKEIADENKTSITKVILHALDVYLKVQWNLELANRIIITSKSNNFTQPKK